MMDTRTISQVVKAAPMPKLRTRYQRTAFAAKLASLLKEHNDSEVQRLALMIETLIAAPAAKVEAMLTIELKESPKLKLLAMGAEKVRE